MKMNIFRAVAIAEGFGEGGEAGAELQAEAWQFLINSGDVWRLQGWYARTARTLIEQGVCKLPVNEPEGAALQLATA